MFSSISDHHGRTAGVQINTYKSVQAWKKPKALTVISDQIARSHVLKNLEKASHGRVGHYDVEFKNALAYANSGKIQSTPKESFKFSDVVDVINPLHHIPVVGMAYRGLTGDELHPASQIIGGAIYGGPVGAVSGTMNAISKIQTGLDLGDHALKMAGLGKKTQKIDNPVINFEQNSTEHNLPGTLLALTDRTIRNEPNPINLKTLKPIEPLTRFQLSPMPVQDRL